MSGDTTSRKSDSAGLENIRKASDAVEKSTAGIAVEKTIERWRTLGAIVVLAITSVLLYQIDGYLSIDSQVFGGITLALFAYFLVTLRTDIRME
ncbi:hypothetical protein C488_17209 [Natrinema pellirubrum DSM 15624]|uniref:Uncharacterized protein n=2 Tax=Natrinema TaxID=88723 RepID=L0JRU3_NATP1|nr:MULTISPECIES: hypothetical protein [Natrinema]ELZ11814.1 hypothetical protein C478_11590 [Natrinema thermotolerans DSM 11552]AGB33322.1 hypothetical protein Natpe_3553 [Natrinema pellirubrum DSM 15624]ELY71691.1 hypothetical protein C488_17209 [Natrinema pellirubrum DSM 15624]QCC58551.1 hypothetical protein DVR14_07870 [Natrinema thermotolerans]WMT09687.1 hypothetical protein NP511_08660 [Natrinema thermotolerans]